MKKNYFKWPEDWRRMLCYLSTIIKTKKKYKNIDKMREYLILCLKFKMSKYKKEILSVLVCLTS